MGCKSRMRIAHLFYDRTDSDLSSKGCEVSRSTMAQRWQDGYHTTQRVLASPQWKTRKPARDGVAVYDLSGRPQI